MNEYLDNVDILILRELQKDAKLTTKELAAKVNLSPSPLSLLLFQHTVGGGIVLYHRIHHVV